MSNEEKVKIFKAFCDERRIEILELLREGEKCACRLLEELNISQPTLSHHMKILCDSKIVVSRKEGKRIYYIINQEGSKKAKELIEELTDKNK
ncbi:ArsR/SmtB family transcription factor [Anaeromicropila populeti]|uniref:Transcriptional regulator, ArsR family n=1 Tax=Anaeromicropila populeti TaxID=37658 RepID=A0A1I6HJG4_9FIRM|nr:metalloregulator ArsR/SmtB family transcription factor [Anaeromicropila populeti]SFR54450.1 transcriptional regulator, ArsR family [Anaeromicropila populeti]